MKILMQSFYLVCFSRQLRMLLGVQLKKLHPLPPVMYLYRSNWIYDFVVCLQYSAVFNLSSWKSNYEQIAGNQRVGFPRWSTMAALSPVSCSPRSNRWVDSGVQEAVEAEEQLLFAWYNFILFCSKTYINENGLTRNASSLWTKSPTTPSHHHTRKTNSSIALLMS